jgi:protein involved in temperature-dependent protein secretion
MTCFLPVLYPDSFLHEDERVKFGRVTDWIPLGNTFYKGAGQHVFHMGNDEIAILELREVVFEMAQLTDLRKDEHAA